MELTRAIAAHSEWKLSLRNAIAERATLDADAVAADTKCLLGRWLHGEARIRYATLPAYAACLHSHASFHLEAGKVAHVANAGDYCGAAAMLDTDTRYASASSALAAALVALRSEAGI